MGKVDIRVRFGTTQGGIAKRRLIMHVNSQMHIEEIDARAPAALIRVDEGSILSLEVKDVDQHGQGSPPKILLDGFRALPNAPCREPICYLEKIAEPQGSVDLDYSTEDHPVASEPEPEPEPEPVAVEASDEEGEPPLSDEPEDGSTEQP